MQGDQWAPHGSATASTDVSMQPSLFVPAANNEQQQQQQQEMNQPMQFMPSQFQPPPAQQYNPMDANQQFNNNNNNQQQHQQHQQYNSSFARPQQRELEKPSSIGWGALFSRTKSFSNVQNDPQSSSSSDTKYRGKVSFSGGFADEPPLLEELGVDFSQIARRAKSSMNPFSKANETSKDDDLAGPLIVFGTIATLHALQGKMHYGYILGWSAIASGLTCWLLNQLTQSNSNAGENLSLSRTASVIGYNAMSILLLSAVKVFFHGTHHVNNGSSSSGGSGSNNSKKGSQGAGNIENVADANYSFGLFLFAFVCVMQASSKSSGLFLNGMGSCGEGKRLVIFYPMILLYSLYALLTLY